MGQREICRVAVRAFALIRIRPFGSFLPIRRDASGGRINRVLVEMRSNTAHRDGYGNFT